MTTSSIRFARNVAGNRLCTAPIQPIAIPLWYGCEVPGADDGAIVLRDELPRRWAREQYTHLQERLLPPVTIPVATQADAMERINQRNMTFLPEIDDANEALAGAVEGAIRSGSLALTLGGDHALAIGTIAGAARNASKVGVIWIDTHPDLNTPESSGSGHIHGMPLGTAIGRTVASMPRGSNLAGRVPMLQPEHICLLGIRDIDPGEQDLILGTHMFARTMDEWQDEGILAGITSALDHLMRQGVDAVHVSFDLDSLDPVFMPGTGTRYPGGLTVREASQILRLLGSWEGPLHSFDFVELNPHLDPTGYSTDVALHLLATALGQRMLGRG